MLTEGLYARRRGGMPISRFQVLGERSSGTNYLSAFLNRNTRLRESRLLGWKHGPPVAQFYPRDMLVVVAVRNPLSWLRSMHRKPWHAAEGLRALGFSEFIRAPWRARIDRSLLTDDPALLYEFMAPPRALAAYAWNRLAPRVGWRLRRPVGRARLSAAMEAAAPGVRLEHDAHPISGRPFRNLLEMRTVKAAAWLGLANRDCSLLIVQHELLTQRPERVAEALSAEFGIAVAGEVRTVARHLGEMDAGDGSGAWRPAPPAALPAADIAHIREQLDYATEAAMGYPLPALPREPA